MHVSARQLKVEEKGKKLPILNSLDFHKINFVLFVKSLCLKNLENSRKSITSFKLYQKLSGTDTIVFSGYSGLPQP